MEFPVQTLTTAVAVPVLGAFLVPLAGRVSAAARATFAVLLAIYTFAAAASLLRPVYDGQFIDYALSFPRGFDFVLRADQLSAFMAALLSFLGAVFLVCAPELTADGPEGTEYCAMAVLLTGSLTGLVLSASLLWLFVFWQLAAFAAWRLSALSGGGGERELLTSASGALCLLLGAAAVYFAQDTLDLRVLRGAPLPWPAAALMLCGVLAGAAGLPFSARLRGGGAQPPASSLTQGTLLAAAGIYAYARLFGTTFAAPDAFPQAVLYLAGATALVCAGAALAETHLGRALAYAAAGQAAFALLGLASGSRAAFAGTFPYLLALGASLGGLLLAAAAAERAAGTGEIGRMGGLLRSAPAAGAAFGLCSLSAIGLPPFGGFFGKYQLFYGAAQNGGSAVLLLFFLAAALTPAYLARLYYKVFLGEPAGGGNAPAGLSAASAGALALGLLGLALGALAWYPSAYAQLLAANLGVNLQ